MRLMKITSIISHIWENHGVLCGQEVADPYLMWIHLNLVGRCISFSRVQEGQTVDALKEFFLGGLHYVPFYYDWVFWKIFTRT